MDFIAPGKPMQNGYCESFNGRMRDELLNETLFLGLDHPNNHRRNGRRLQPIAPTFGARIPHACGLSRQSHRNGRSAAQPRPAPPIARGSTRAIRRKTRRAFNCSRMKFNGRSLMQRLPLAIAFRKVVPMRPGAQDPQDPVHKQPIVPTAAAGITSLARQQTFDTLPLLAAQCHIAVPSIALQTESGSL